MKPEEGIERYTVLLLGAVDRPIPSFLHLQRELFVISGRDHGGITKEAYQGQDQYPDLDVEPTKRLYERDQKGNFHITPMGKKAYNELVKVYRSDLKFRELINRTKLVRELYDKMSEEELLYLFST
jgi:hypothetical protein